MPLEFNSIEKQLHFESYITLVKIRKILSKDIRYNRISNKHARLLVNAESRVYRRFKKMQFRNRVVQNLKHAMRQAYN